MCLLAVTVTTERSSDRVVIGQIASTLWILAGHVQPFHNLKKIFFVSFTVHCYIIMYRKTTKCTLFKLIV